MSEIPQLVLSKRLLQESFEFLKRGGGIHFGMAVSMAQDSVELTLRAIVKHQSVVLKSDKAGFMEIIQAINEHFKSDSEPWRVPVQGGLEDLNRARIGFKHHGLTPSKVDAYKLVEYAKVFFQSVCPQIFSVDFDKLSLADLLEYEEVRGRLKQAESALQEENFQECFGCSAEVVELSFQRMETLFPLEHINLAWQLGELRNSRGIRSVADNIQRELHKQFEKLREIAFLSSLSIDIFAYRRFKELTPVIQTMVGGKMILEYMRPIEGYKEAEFCKSFAIDFALAVEQKLVR